MGDYIEVDFGQMTQAMRDMYLGRVRILQMPQIGDPWPGNEPPEPDIIIENDQ